MGSLYIEEETSTKTSYMRLLGLLIALAVLLSLTPAVTFPARQTGDKLAQTYVDMLNELAK